MCVSLSSHQENVEMFGVLDTRSAMYTESAWKPGAERKR